MLPEEYGRITVPGPPPTKKNTPIPVIHGLWGGRGLKKFFEILLEHLQALPVYSPAEPLRYREALTELAKGTALRARLVAEIERSAADAFPTVLPNRDYQKALKWWVPHARHAWKPRPSVGYDKRPVRVTGRFYVPTGKRSDLISYMEALADLLEEAGIVENDYWLWWDSDTDVYKVAENYRTEIIIRPYLPKMDDGGQLTILAGGKDGKVAGKK